MGMVCSHEGPQAAVKCLTASNMFHNRNLAGLRSHVDGT